MFKHHVIYDEIVISGVDNRNVVSVEIPEFINGYPVTSIESHSFSWCDNLTNIKIPNSVINIDGDAFEYNTSLKFINNVEIKGGFCVINNRHIWFRTDIFKINYQIGGDYCVYTDYIDLRYFINNEKYYKYFNTLYRL